MAPRRATTPDPDTPDTATATDVDATAVDGPAPAAPLDELVELVTARYIGVDPVLAVFDGVQQIIDPGDPITVTAEQLAQNPVFEPWED